MAKLTLLQMTQKILTAMDSDYVDDISDTEESLQVVDIIEDTYYELMSQRDWNHLKNPVVLEAPTAPATDKTTLKIPETVAEIKDVRYDCREEAGDPVNYKVVTYKHPDEFTDMMFRLTSTDSNVESLTVIGSTTPLLVENDRAPRFWTSFDDEHIVFDAYDSSLESQIDPSKSIVYAVTIPVFDSGTNSYTPDCPITMFPTLLAESKRACFIYLKQQDSPMDAKRSVRGFNHLKNGDYRAHERSKKARYGRRRY